MPKSIRLLVVEDDPYARDAMCLLLCQDWHTRVVAEAGSYQAALKELKKERKPLEKKGRTLKTSLQVMLLDVEAPSEPEWPLRLIEQSHELAGSRRVQVLCTATHADPDLVKDALDAGADGFVLKQECGWALAEAVVGVYQRQFVVTPSIKEVIQKRNLRPKGRDLLVDGTQLGSDLSWREMLVARRYLVYSPSYEDLGDEFQIRADEPARAVRRIYDKTRTYELLDSGRPEDFFGDEVVIEQVGKIMEAYYEKLSEREVEAGAGAESPHRRIRAPQQDTICFHLLTKSRRKMQSG